MGKSVLKIGICGGTFDPVHIGHLAIAELVRNEFKLDKVLFIPSGMPPHKNIEKVTSPTHRLNMVKLAVASNPKFEACSIEVEREGYTYTVDTLKELHRIYPPETEFYYIIGADVVRDLLTWKSTSEVFKLTSFIAIMRPGFVPESFNEKIVTLKSLHEANITTIELPLFEISSTFIRARVKALESIKYLVETSVEEYIVNNNLYL